MPSEALSSCSWLACSKACDPLFDFIMPCIRLRIHCLPTVGPVPYEETQIVLPFSAVRGQGERLPELDQADTLIPGLLDHKLWGTYLTFMPSCLRKTMPFQLLRKLETVHTMSWKCLHHALWMRAADTTAVHTHVQSHCTLTWDYISLAGDFFFLITYFFYWIFGYFTPCTPILLISQPFHVHPPPL